MSTAESLTALDALARRDGKGKVVLRLEYQHHSRAQLKAREFRSARNNEWRIVVMHRRVGVRVTRNGRAVRGEALKTKQCRVRSENRWLDRDWVYRFVRQIDGADVARAHRSQREEAARPFSCENYALVAGEHIGDMMQGSRRYLQQAAGHMCATGNLPFGWSMDAVIISRCEVENAIVESRF